MSLRRVTWKEVMDEWHQHPEKLLAWITKQFWDAQISLDASMSWQAKDGTITIFGKSLKEVRTIE